MSHQTVLLPVKGCGHPSSTWFLEPTKTPHPIRHLDRHSLIAVLSGFRLVTDRQTDIRQTHSHESQTYHATSVRPHLMLHIAMRPNNSLMLTKIQTKINVDISGKGNIPILTSDILLFFHAAESDSGWLVGCRADKAVTARIQWTAPLVQIYHQNVLYAAKKARVGQRINYARRSVATPAARSRIAATAGKCIDHWAAELVRRPRASVAVKAILPTHGTQQAFIRLPTRTTQWAGYAIGDRRFFPRDRKQGQGKPVRGARNSFAVEPCTTQLRYDTIRDAILTCARNPTWVSFI